MKRIQVEITYLELRKTEKEERRWVRVGFTWLEMNQH